MKIITTLLFISLLCVATSASNDWTFRACQCSDFNSNTSCPNTTCDFQNEACSPITKTQQCKNAYQDTGTCADPYCRLSNGGQCVSFSNCESLSNNKQTLTADFCGNYYCGFNDIKQRCYTPFSGCQNITSQIECNRAKLLTNWEDNYDGDDEAVQNVTNIPSEFLVQTCLWLPGTDTGNATCTQFTGCEQFNTTQCETLTAGRCYLKNQTCTLKDCSYFSNTQRNCEEVFACTWTSINVTNTSQNACVSTNCSSYNQTSCPQSHGIDGYCAWNGRTCNQCFQGLDGAIQTAILSILGVFLFVSLL